MAKIRTTFDGRTQKTYRNGCLVSVALAPQTSNRPVDYFNRAGPDAVLGGTDGWCWDDFSASDLAKIDASPITRTRK